MGINNKTEMSKMDSLAKGWEERVFKIEAAVVIVVQGPCSISTHFLHPPALTYAKQIMGSLVFDIRIR